MKNISTGVIGVLCLVIILGIFYIGYQRGQEKQMKKVLEAKEKEVTEVIKERDKELWNKEKEIVALNKKLEEVNERLDGLAEERTRWKEEAEKWKKKASEAPPETLIADIREILGTTEVWLVEDGILFSVDAFRKVTEKLYDWEDFTLVREPNYKQTIENYKTKVYLLTDSNGLLKEQIQTLSDIRALQKVWNEEMKAFIVKSSGSSFWSTLKNIGTGIAIGAFGVIILVD
jgi:hypothetical protein